MSRYQITYFGGKTEVQEADDYKIDHGNLTFNEYYPKPDRNDIPKYGTYIVTISPIRTLIEGLWKEVKKLS